jgi:hypothetical protein
MGWRSFRSYFDFERAGGGILQLRLRPFRSDVGIKLDQALLGKDLTSQPVKLKYRQFPANFTSASPGRL